MANKVDGLLAKRRELIARRRALKGELTSLAADVSAIDRVLGTLDAAYKPEVSARATRDRPAEDANPFPQGKMVVAILEHFGAG